MFDKLFHPRSVIYLYPSMLQIMVADSDESQLWMHAGRHEVVFGE